jgi:DNA polymerase-3 subunit epsilon
MLHGEVLVFTGSLSEARQFAADRAGAAGCTVDDGVTKHTTILVVGNQDIRVLAGKTKSNKHLKAEALIAKGQQLRIITERDFMEVTATH